MSLEWLIKGETGYYRGPATVGIIKGNTGWILVDSTVETDAVKKIVKALSAYEQEAHEIPNHGRISAVINTHAHADHCGGNQWLQKQFGTEVIASAGESVYIENPELEPHYLFSAHAPKPFWNKFFCAPPSVVNRRINFGNVKNDPQVGQVAPLEVDGVNLHLVSIPGHSLDMMGVITEEGYFFCGDLLFTPQILNKHPLLFLHDPTKYVASLEWAASASFSGVVLTHGAFHEDHQALVTATLERLKANALMIDNVLQSPKTDTEVHQAIAEALGLQEDLGGWHLNHGVIRSYLGQGLQAGRFSWSQGTYCIQVQSDQ